RKGDHDALLGLDAALGEYVAEPIGQRLDLPVGERPLVGEHGRPMALPFTHAGVEEVVGDVELFGRLEAHRDRYRPWTAGGQPPGPVRYSHPWQSSTSRTCPGRRIATSTGRRRWRSCRAAPS